MRGKERGKDKDQAGQRYETRGSSRLFLSSSRDVCRSGAAASVPRRKTVAPCAATTGAGRSNASSGNLGRLVVRYGHHTLNYFGFVHLGYILNLLRQRSEMTSSSGG